MATFFISSQSILLSPLFCVVLFGIFLFEIKIQIKASEQDFDMAIILNASLPRCLTL